MTQWTTNWFFFFVSDQRLNEVLRRYQMENFSKYSSVQVCKLIKVQQTGSFGYKYECKINSTLDYSHVKLPIALWNFGYNFDSCQESINVNSLFLLNECKFFDHRNCPFFRVKMSVLNSKMKIHWSFETF